MYQKESFPRIAEEHSPGVHLKNYMSVIDNLLYKIDLVDLAGEYTNLHSYQDGSYRGQCPIHHGDNPSSLSVWPDHYYCFSCGSYGNSIQFYAEVEGLAFYQSVEKLCDKYEVSFDDPNYQKQKSMVGNNTMAANKFHNNVSEIVEYLTKRRGLSNESIDDFLLGYDSGRFMDKSPGLIIPIQDMYGRIVGFSKRKLDDTTPKYRNSADNDVFHKGDILFNMHRAVKLIKNYNVLHIVEGYMDVISAHQQGIPCVGYMGSKPTKNQILLLKDIQKRYPDISFVLSVDNPKEDSTARKMLPRIRKDLVKYAPELDIRCPIFPGG